MQTMALGEDYLNTSGFVQTVTDAEPPATSITISNSNCSCFTWPCQCHHTVYVPWAYSYTPSITLSMEQAEHLRKVAKKDKKLAEILRLFRPYIAVEVPDFE